MKILYLTITFAVGFCFGVLMFPFFKTESKIPEGVWDSFYIDNDLSLQINITQSVLNGQILSTWVREDRLDFFEGTSGLSGHTIFSKVIFNCETLTATITEQRAFKSGMIFIGTKRNMDATSKSPTELMSVISLITLCQYDKPEQTLPIKQEENSVKSSLLYSI